MYIQKYIYIHTYTHTHTHSHGLPWWLSGKKICLPMQETQVQSLIQEEPLKKEMAIDSSILASNIVHRGMDRGAWCGTVHVVAKSWT